MGMLECSNIISSVATHQCCETKFFQCNYYIFLENLLWIHVHDIVYFEDFEIVCPQFAIRFEKSYIFYHKGQGQKGMDLVSLKDLEWALQFNLWILCTFTCNQLLEMIFNWPFVLVLLLQRPAHLVKSFSIILVPPTANNSLPVMQNYLYTFEASKKSKGETRWKCIFGNFSVINHPIFLKFRWHIVLDKGAT